MLFEDLEAFIAVARLRSFSRAAERLRVAQSSLSKRVQRLEQHFGAALLTRHGRGVSLTASGTVLLARSDKLLREMQDVEQDVRGIRGDAVGLVRLAMPPATSPVLAPLVFEQCAAEFPRITLQLREATSDVTHQWMSSGEVDLALMHNPEYGADLVVEPLVSDPLFIIAPAIDRATGEPARYPDSYAIEDLARLPLILPRRPHSIRVLVERLCAGNAIHPRILFESDSIRTTKGIVASGFGCTVFGKTGLQDDIAAGRLRAIPFSSALLSWQLCLTHARREDVSLAVMSVQGIILRKVDELFKTGFWPDGRRLPRRRPPAQPTARARPARD